MGDRRRLRRIELRLALVAYLVVLNTAETAWAQSPGSADAKTQARQLYDEGLTNYNLGHYTVALGSFESGYKLWHDPSFLFNIAQCERALNRYQDAERTYRAFVRESSGISDAQRDKIQRLIQEMEKAIQAERAKQPPVATQPPMGAEQGARTPTQSPSSALNLTAAAPQTQRSKPVYRRGWFWGVMASVAVVAVGVGVGVGLGVSHSNPFPPVQF